MPTVSKREIQVTGIGRWMLEIKCNSKGEFSALLPTICLNVIGKNKIEAKSLVECEKGFFSALAEYREAKTTKRKVILYEIKEEKAFANGIDLNVCAAVFVEERITGIEGKTGRVNYVEERSTLDDSDISNGTRNLTSYLGGREKGTVIEWTEEREAFFLRIGKALEAVRAEVRKLKDPKTAAAIADKGALLLMEPTKPAIGRAVHKRKGAQ